MGAEPTPAAPRRTSKKGRGAQAGDAGSRTGARENVQPGAREGGKPGAREGGKPGAREGVRPSARERVQPSARERVQPSAREGVRPGAREGVRPSARERVQPSAREGVRPRARGGARRAGVDLTAAARRLRYALADYPARAPADSVDVILNPLDYAWALHEAYLERFAPRAPGQVEAVFVGMNPGPWGMAQTGVPFGSPDVVRGFLGLEGEVHAPARAHPKRPIVGLASPRNEVSGQRLWGGVEAAFGAPEAFFARFFVLNYCPLVFQSATGANLTPDKLRAELVGPCLEACDVHMRDALTQLAPRTVIGVGRWAEQRLARSVAAWGLDVEVRSILHPNPASPAANRGWLAAARTRLAAIGHPWPIQELDLG